MLLLPFAFQRVYAPPLSITALLRGSRGMFVFSVSAWFPGGATLSSPYLLRFPVTRYYGCSDSSHPPDFRLSTLLTAKIVITHHQSCQCGDSRYPRLKRHTLATAPPRITPDDSAMLALLRALQQGASARLADWLAI